MIIQYSSTPVWQSGKLSDILVSDLYTKITTVPELITATDTIRSIDKVKDSQTYKSMKGKLPYICASHFSNHKREANSDRLAHYLLFDIDTSLTKSQLLTLKKMQTTLLFYKTISNNYRLICYLDKPISDAHLYKALYNHYANGLKKILNLSDDAIDTTSADIMRVGYINNDPDAYFNADALPLSTTISSVVDAAKKSAYTHNQNVQSFSTPPESVIDIFGLFIDDYRDAIILQSESADIRYDIWRNVGFALATIGEAGRPLFHKFSDNDLYSDTSVDIDNAYDTFLRSTTNKDTTLLNIYWLYKELRDVLGIDIPTLVLYSNLGIDIAKHRNIPRWFYNTEKGLVIDPKTLRSFLTYSNLYKHGGQYVQVVNNIAEPISDTKFFIAVERVVRGLFKDKSNRTIDRLLDKLYTPSYLLGSKMLLHLMELDTSYFYAPKNISIYTHDYIIEFIGTNISLIEYSDLDKFVWASKIVNYKIDIDRLTKLLHDKAEPTSVVKTFVERATGENSHSAESVIGYYLSKDKTRSNFKVVVLLDKSFDVANGMGGAGKGVFVQILSSLMSTIMIDGNKQRTAPQWFWESVTSATDLVIIEDPPQRFSYQELNTSITNDLVVARKREHELIIPFDISPKIIISSNFLPDQSISTKRRIHELLFTDYYIKRAEKDGSDAVTNDLGGYLFGDDFDWTALIYYAFYCIAKYNKNGLITAINSDYNQKLLDETTNDDMIDIIEDMVASPEANGIIVSGNSYIFTSKGIKLPMREHMKRYSFSHSQIGYFKQPFVIVKHLKIFADTNGFTYDKSATTLSDVRKRIDGKPNAIRCFVLDKIATDDETLEQKHDVLPDLPF